MFSTKDFTIYTTQTHEYTPHPHIPFNMHSNIMLPYMASLAQLHFSVNLTTIQATYPLISHSII